jgi:hypothetical protein
MDPLSLIPRYDDRCAFCGQLIVPDAEAVLVHDCEETAQWWHMRCRDMLIPTLIGESDSPARDADDPSR